MITTLEKFGLSEKQAKIYLAALELGPSAVQVISKKAGVNRATTYVILEGLMKLGLISTYEKDKKTLYTAESPKYLERLIHQEEEVIKAKKEEFSQILPELEASFNTAGGKPIVRYFEGKQGFESLKKELLDATEPGDTSYTATNLDDVYSLYPEYKEKQLKERIKSKRNLKQIYNCSQGAIRKSIDKEALRESRFVPRNKFPIDISLNIIPGKVVRIATYKGGFSGISINHPQIARSLQSLYNLAWETATKYNKEARNKNKKKAT